MSQRERFAAAMARSRMYAVTGWPWVDPTEGLPYPVCAFHARAYMVPLTALVNALRVPASTEGKDAANGE